jgi:hypothetical protein
MVCDICWDPDPLIKQTRPDVKVNTNRSEYLLGEEWKTAQADICAKCLALFQKRDWAGLAERAQQATIRRLEA